MNWMAPEVLERPYDERSDVWSAGCIALEMATCGFYDHAQMSSRLFEIKKSPPALEETLEEVKKVCDEGVVWFVDERGKLLRNDHKPLRGANIFQIILPQYHQLQ